MRIVQKGVPSLAIKEFADALAHPLLNLVRALKLPELRTHPVWGSLLPFDMRPYGTRPSPGHIIRPDIILSPEGFKVVEFDFIPSGRGIVLNCLTDASDRAAFITAFVAWYQTMSFKRVAYATTVDRPLVEDARYFCAQLRRYGFDIRDVDANEYEHKKDELFDRLFYHGTLKHPIGRVTTLTSECWLDSKLVFALIHDPKMSGWMERNVGKEEYAFLKAATPETFLVNPHDPQLTQFVKEKDAWVLKNTDVETNACWGSRGVVIGRKFRANAFRRFLQDDNPPKSKELGAHPILQRFIASVDFSPWWVDIATGVVKKPDTDALSLCADIAGPTEHVYARLGIYYLISCASAAAIRYVPFGLATLRQDELAHGARNALFCAFRIA